MSRTPPVYNSNEKVWTGPAIDKANFNVPFGEMLLKELAKNDDQLIQVRCNVNTRIASRSVHHTCL